MAKQQQPSFAIAIMAAGKGTRLKSKHPKVLHEIGGKPMLRYVIDVAATVVPIDHVYAIIGYEAERVRRAMGDAGAEFILQTEQRGTGHALMVARDALSKYDHILVLSGDTPLIRPEIIGRLRDFHLQNHSAMTILTADLEQPGAYGRVIRKQARGGDHNEVAAIVEVKALKPEQRDLHEINSGIYAFATKALFAHIDQLTTDNAHREYYLTDMAGLLADAGEKVLALKEDAIAETLGVNTRAELAQLDAQVRMAKAHALMDAGVTIYRPETCVIDADVTVAADTVLEPFVQLLGKTTVGCDCRIRSGSIISNSHIGDEVTVRPGSIIESSRVDHGAILGPYCHLRPGSDIGPGAHIGNFVETKKVKMGRGSKANHLTYLGDAVIGENVNVGAGTITCNYDGISKHQTTIEDGAFIGSDATLVAPVRVGKDAYVGAASCITDDVPQDALALGRARQTVKPDWVKQKRQQTVAAKKSSGS